MNTNIKFSIVVPVYNVEKYIKRCLDSIINQEGVSHSEYEIIVVDDGSPDNSGQIAEKLLKDIPNSKVIHQSNMGLSEARNNGFKVAKGEYVWFIDSDDWIEPNSLKTLLNYILLYNDVDVYMIKAWMNYSKGNKELQQDKFPFEDKGIQSGVDVFLTHSWQTCAQFYIFRREFLVSECLRFMQGIYHEDNEFTPRMLCKSKSIIQLNEILYNSYTNDESITHVPNIKRPYDLLKVCDSLNSFYETENLSENATKRMSAFIGVTFNYALFIISQNFYDKKTEFNKEISKRRHILDHLKKSGVLKYRIESFLFRICPDYVRTYTYLNHLK